MKRFMCVVCAIFMCIGCFAKTIRWHVGGSVYTTTCNSGDSVTPPTAPSENGYSFVEWIPYQQIEYLESTGTQWIDTGFYPNEHSLMEIKFICRRGGVAYIKEPSVSNAWGIWNTSEAKTNLYYPGTDIFPSDISSQQPNIVILGPVSTTVNQVTSEHNNTVFQYNSTSVGLFTAWDNGRHLDYCRGRIYYAKFYKDNVLVHNFVPVRDKNDVVCMYDKVTQRFFYNQGTGQFVAGPVVSE